MIPRVAQLMVGVMAPSGTTIAFPVAAARAQLEAGGSVALDGVVVFLDGSGLRAETVDGDDLVAHEAFWFAWSQFHPDTVVWVAP